MKKIYLLLSLFILTVSCEKDAEILEEAQQKSPEPLMNISDVGSEEIKNNTRIFESLKSLGSLASSKKNDQEISFIYDSINDFTIDIRHAKKIKSKNGKYHSYTFSIVGHDDSLNNLLYSLQEDGSYHVFKITYKLSEDEKEKLADGKHIDLYGKGKVTQLKNGVLLSDTNKSFTTTCLFATVTWCSSTKNHPGGYFSDGSPCDAHESTTEKYCSTTYDGGGGSTTDPSDPSLGGGGGSGGGTTNPDDDTCIADGDGNCFGDTTTPTLDLTTTNQKLITTLQLYNTSTLGSWINSASLRTITPIYNFIKDNGFTPQAKAFGLKATNEIMQGSMVDFVEQVILKPSFTANTRLYGIYTDMGRASAFENYLQNFIPEGSVANLRFDYDMNFGANNPEYTNAMALTKAPANYLIDIVFNGDNNLSSSINNKPDLTIALSFIHEIIHAEMYRLLLSSAQLPELNYQNMSDEQWKNFVNNLKRYDGIYDYFLRYKYFKDNGVMIPIEGPTAEQHQQMAQHYRSIIIDAISTFDNNQHSASFYSAFSWQGLMGTGTYFPATGLFENSTEAWKYIDEDPNLSPAQERINIRNIIINFQQ